MTCQVIEPRTPPRYRDPIVERHLRPTVGALLREWRQRRHLSQLELAGLAGVSTRHLSFIETGRSRPSREMVLHLAEQLDVPLRERNPLLLAAGHAPAYASTAFDADSMRPVREALDRVLRSHQPFPALVVNRMWELVAANDGVPPLLAGVADHLLVPPVNVLRVSLHPEGMAPRIVNFGEWSGHLLHRLRRQFVLTRDADVGALYDELRSYPNVAPDDVHVETEDAGALAVPFVLRTDGGELRFLSTVTTFGTAVDITLAELSIEAFLPADDATAAALSV
jgi:transcriptional regulator with XRE-family HTH domain